MYGCIGNIYATQRNYSKTLEYFHRCLKLSEEMRYDYGIILALSNIATVYLIQNQLEKSMEYYQKSLVLNNKFGIKKSIGFNLLNISIIYYRKHEFEKSLEYRQKSLKIFEEINYREGICTNLSDIGLTYLKLSKPQIAYDHIQKAVIIANEIKSISKLSSCYQALSQADFSLGDYNSAYENYKLYKQYSDSLHNDEKSKEFGKIESKFQFEKEAEIEKRKQEEQAKIEAEKQERRNNLQYLTIFVTLISLFAGLVFMGKLNIPVKVMDIALFAGLLILFEFLLILFDPLFDKYSGGIPLYKLGFIQ